MTFSVHQLAVGYHGKALFSGLNCAVGAGEILCILGPNGVGKTTLFKTILGLLPPVSGSVTIDGESLHHWSARRRADYLGYVPQTHMPPFPYTVMDVAVMGCMGKKSAFAAPQREDFARVERLLEQLGIGALQNRPYTEISGGERQLVLIARALAQRPRILLMDEPTANLDFGHQAQLLALLGQLAQQGLAVILTTHTPDHALRCNAKVLLLARGAAPQFGTAAQLIQPEPLSRAYGVDICLTRGQYHNQEIMGCVPLMRGAAPRE